MGRYSPTERQISGLEVFGEVAENVADDRDRRRALAIEEQERAEAAEDRALSRELAGLQLNRARADLHATGYRATAPTVRDEPDMPDVFAGAELDRPGGGRQVPSIFEDERPSFLPQRREPMARGDGENEPDPALPDTLTGLQRPRPPRLVALPGAYVRGRGFTERALTDLDLLNEQAATALRPDTRMGMQQTDRPPSAGGRQAYLEQPTRETVDPDYDPLPGGGFMKRSSTKAAKVMEAARALGATPAELRMIEADPDFADAVYRRIQGEQEEGREADWIDVDGRRFPNTPAGAAAAQAWREGGRTPRSEAGDWEIKETIDGSLVRVNKVSGEVKPVAGVKVKPEGNGAPPRGTPEYLRMLEEEARARGAASGANTEQARMARALAPLMEDAVTRISEMDTPTLREKIAGSGRIIGNYFNTPEGRQFRQASLQFLQSALSITSGKTVTEQEAERNEAIYIPQPGEDAKTIEIKMTAMRTLATAARALAGGGGHTVQVDVGDIEPAFSDDPDEAAEQALQMMRGGGR